MPKILDYEIPPKKKFDPNDLGRILMPGLALGFIVPTLTPNSNYLGWLCIVGWLAGLSVGYCLRNARIPRRAKNPLLRIYFLIVIPLLLFQIELYNLYQSLLIDKYALSLMYDSAFFLKMRFVTHFALATVSMTFMALALFLEKPPPSQRKSRGS